MSTIESLSELNSHPFKKNVTHRKKTIFDPSGVFIIIAKFLAEFLQNFDLPK